jgi:hypothetical protein
MKKPVKMHMRKGKMVKMHMRKGTVKSHVRFRSPSVAGTRTKDFSMHERTN